MAKKGLKNKEKLELALFLVYPVFIAVLSLLIKANLLMGVLLFLALPSIYLSLKVPFNTFLRSLLFSIVSIPIICVINFLAHKNLQWVIPYTFVPFYIDGIPMFEVSLWMFFLLHFTILFYEYFIDKHFTKKVWYPSMKYLLYLIILLPPIFLMINHFFPLTYFYLIFGLIGILIPVLLVELNFPKLMAKFTKVAMYFFYVTFLYEITALKLNHWYFPKEGKFIGWITIFGEWFPIEELVFWLILCAMAILSYFEYFDDDKK
jgi:hypothetical protein